MSFLLLTDAEQNGVGNPAVNGWAVGYEITPSADVSVLELGAFVDLATKDIWTNAKQIRCYRKSNAELVGSVDIARAEVGTTAYYEGCVVLKAVTPFTLLSGIAYILQVDTYFAEPMRIDGATDKGTPDLGDGLIAFTAGNGFYTTSPTAMADTAGASAPRVYFGPTMRYEAAGGGGEEEEIALGFIGDSITEGTVVGGNTNSPPTREKVYLESLDENLTVTVVNQGVSGKTTADWQVGGDYLPGAKSAFAAAGVSVVNIMLGTNDSKVSVATSKATYKSRLLAICNDLVSSGYTVQLNQVPYVAPGAGSGQWGADVEETIQGYNEAINEIVNRTTIKQGDTTAYAYVRDTPSAQYGDDIHLSVAGSDVLGQRWGMAYLSQPATPGAEEQINVTISTPMRRSFGF